jgi:3-oxoacyl-[acyl-carrier-protein] synthase-3
MKTIIIGSGSYLPKNIIKNQDFLKTEFYDASGKKIPKTNEEIIKKFEEITGIKERRYMEDEHKSSDIAALAAQKAIESAGIDKEELDYIIVAHNFGDLQNGTHVPDLVPSLSSRVKYHLGIENPYCVSYDILFGCPGWLQATIQADYYLKSGKAKYALVIGVENLSRVSDPHDIDSMIYSDGAGAVILKAEETNEEIGIIDHISRSDTKDYVWMLKMDKSYKEGAYEGDLFLKMNGRRIYEYAVNTVPVEIKKLLDRNNIDIHQVKKVLLHQANEKMDIAMIQRVFKSYGIKEVPKDIMPMIISKMGNNSVATLPIMFDMISKGNLEGHKFNSGDYLVFASVGAGLNVNTILYRVP